MKYMLILLLPLLSSCAQETEILDLSEWEATKTHEEEYTWTEIIIAGKTPVPITHFDTKVVVDQWTRKGSK